MTRQVFISCSPADQEKAHQIVGYLENTGVTCWEPSRDIPAGEAWSEAIMEAVNGCSMVLVILSANTVQSRYILRELERAVSRRIPVLPVQTEEVDLSLDLEYYLSTIHWVDALSLPFSKHFERVAAAVHGILGESIPPKTDSSVQALDSHSPPHRSIWHTLFGALFPSKKVAEERISGQGSSIKSRSSSPTPDPVEKKEPDRPARFHGGFDVFICYRRKDGAAVARLMRNELQSRELKVFLDIEDLGAGHYDDKLLRYIEQAPNFLPILTPNCLDSRGGDEDWMLKEIAYAIVHERNIVPMVMPGFRFPNPLDLPQDIRALPRHNGVEFSNSYYQAMIERLITYLID